MRRPCFLLLAAALVARSAIAAGPTPETRCQRDRYKAAGNYVGCQTFFELQTLLLVTSTCPFPCIDAMFGTGTELVYWSASTQRLTPDAITAAWFVAFGNGGLGGNDKKDLHAIFAVRRDF